MIIVRKIIPTTAPALDLATARDAVQTACSIVAVLDGRRTTEVERQNALTDALDLAFFVAGTVHHLDAAAIEARAYVLATA